MRYVLDTNIVVAALNGDTEVARRLNSLSATDEVVLPAIVLAELRYGALTSRRVAENMTRIERLMVAVSFAPVDRPVAERFGDMKAALRQRGVSKSDADLLIAATAVVLSATLVSHDQALLDGSLTNLIAEDWLV